MYLDEMTDLCDEIIHRVMWMEELSNATQLNMRKKIKEEHFDAIVEFRDFLNAFIDKRWDFSAWNDEFKEMRKRFCERNDAIECGTK